MPSRDISSSTLYGKGVFTTITVREGQPVFWDKHWRRLEGNADALGIDLTGHTDGSTFQVLEGEIDAVGIVDGRARVTFSDESSSRIWSNETGRTKTSISIVAAPSRSVPENFKLTISPHRVNTTSPLVGIKSCNYLEHLLAHEEAMKRGFHEAVRLNEDGMIVSACMANLFWEKGGNLYTPSVRTGCMPGTTREHILENIVCDEVESGLKSLENADWIFLTSAGIGIVSVAEFNGRPLATASHPLSRPLPF